MSQKMIYLKLPHNCAVNLSEQSTCTHYFAPTAQQNSNPFSQAEIGALNSSAPSESRRSNLQAPTDEIWLEDKSIGA